MQHFLKPATGTAWAKIIASQFLGQIFVAVNDAHPAFDFRFRREAAAALASFLVESHLCRIVVFWP
jgi:hypothetical protein